MIHLRQALLRLETDLRRFGLEWAVIGGLAVSVRAEPRTTRDLDIAVAVEADRQAERIIGDLLGRGYRLATPPLEHLKARRLATARLLAPKLGVEAVIVDLLFASSGIEQEIIAAAEALEVLPGIIMPVATTGHLLALKTLAGREKICRIFDRCCWSRARTTCRQLAKPWS